MPPKIIISAMSYDHVIGTEDGMPWNVPEEYQQYLDFIRGNTVIMGRKSYEIFGDDLTSEHTLVVSRSMELKEGIEVFESLESAISRAEELEKDIFIAGGSSIYEQCLEKADNMYLSFIKGQYEGIACFPKFNLTNWKIIKREEHLEFEFVVFEAR